MLAAIAIALVTPRCWLLLNNLRYNAACSLSQALHMFLSLSSRQFIHKIISDGSNRYSFPFYISFYSIYLPFAGFPSNLSTFPLLYFLLLYLPSCCCYLYFSNFPVICNAFQQTNKQMQAWLRSACMFGVTYSDQIMTEIFAPKLLSNCPVCSGIREFIPAEFPCLVLLVFRQ